MREILKQLTAARVKLTRGQMLLQAASHRLGDVRNQQAAQDAELFLRQALRCLADIELDDETAIII